MELSQSEGTGTKKPNMHRRFIRILTVAVVVLLTVISVLPAALRLLYRADAQVALGNAKVVRQALQAVGTKCYGQDIPFGDTSSKGGVTEEVYREVLLLSKVSGDFWILQYAEDGVHVEKFLYQEDEYTVYFQENPLSYEVYRNEQYIKTNFERKK